MMRWLGDRLFAWRRGWESAPDPLSCLPMLGLLAFLLAASVLPARGDEIPGFGAPWDAYYFSTDMTPVTVHLVRNRDAFTPETARRQPVVATARLPRAYIYFASGYKQPEYPVVPDELWTSHFELMITYPSGEPYSVAWRRLREQGLSYSAATRQLRPLLNMVQLNPSTLAFATTLTAHEAGARQVESEFEGVIESYYSRGGPIFFRFPENPAVRMVTCLHDVERTHSDVFCRYQIILDDLVSSAASFLDFRLHGGVRFANERVYHIQEVLCRFVTCNPRWSATQER